MSKIKHLIAFVLLLLLCSYKEKQDDTMLLLKEIYNKVSLQELPKDNRVYFFDYEVNVQLANPQRTESKSRVKVYLSKGHFEILSNQMSVYQDLKNSFTVLPLRKEIYWNESQFAKKDSSKAGAPGDQSNLSFLNGQVFDHCKIISSSDIKGEHFNKEIVLQPDENIRKLYKIEEVRFLIHTSKKTIKETLIKYAKGGQFDHVAITYYNIDYDYGKADLGGPVKSKIFKSNGDLQPQYSQYRVVDNRGKSN